MAAPAWAEARLALAGALRLARGDRGGFACFDISIDGFWHSFRAALLCYPLYLILLSYPATPRAAASAASEWHGLVLDSIRYVIAWVAFPLLVLPVADRFGRGDRFLGFMVAYNWCQVPQTALFAVVALAGAAGILSPDATSAADLVAALAALVYEWFVARVGLALSGTRAALIVALDILLATVLSEISAALY